MPGLVFFLVSEQNNLDMAKKKKKKIFKGQKGPASEILDTLLNAYLQILFMPFFLTQSNTAV